MDAQFQQILQHEQARLDNFGKQSVLEFTREKSDNDMETESYRFILDSFDFGV